MKKLLPCLLICALLLSACSFVPTRVRDLDDDDDKQSIRKPVTESVVATTAPVMSVDVTYNYYAENGSEYAAIQGFDRDGNQLWVVTTALLPMAQMERVTDIGRYEDRYYYIEDGAVVALDVYTGSILWKNADFGGCPTEDCIVIGDSGRLYLSGFFGPDLAVIEPDGQATIYSSLTEDYYWPCRLEVDEAAGVATVYMSGGPEGDMGSANAHPIAVDLP